MEYLHRNHRDIQQEPLSEDEIVRFISSKEKHRRFQEMIDFTSNGGKRVFWTEDCMPNEERIGVFLHPRFLPMVTHGHPHHEIKYIFRGRAALCINGQSLIMENGDFCFISPMVEHNCSIFDPDTLLINFEIRPEALRTVFQRVFQTRNAISNFYNSSGSAVQVGMPFLLCHTGEDTEIRDLVDLIYAYKGEMVRQGYGELTSEMLVEQMLLLLLERHKAAFSDGQNDLPESQTMFEILNYVRQNLGTVTLLELSQHFNYSESYMSRRIKQNTGFSFSELLRNARLDRAAELLRDTELPVSNIISEVGYAGKAYFYRSFQTKFGMTPIELRKKFRQGPDKER